MPSCWVVERTFTWLGQYHRLSKDFEILTSSAENTIRIAILKKHLQNTSEFLSDRHFGPAFPPPSTT
jgi:hypothetical protein